MGLLCYRGGNNRRDAARFGAFFGGSMTPMNLSVKDAIAEAKNGVGQTRMLASTYRKTKTRESGEQGAILQLCDRMGWVMNRVNAGDMFKKYTTKSGENRTHCVKGAPKGTPDVGGYIPLHVLKKHSFTCYSARPAYVEVKRKGGTVRPAQEEFISKAKKDGCFAHIVFGFEEFERILRKEGFL